MKVLDNTPSNGYISWQDVNISYKGQVYKIANGATDFTYIYWKYSDPLSFYGSNAFPTLGDDDLLVFLNKNGTHLTVPNTTIVDGSLIVPESIMASALSANSVTSEKILAGSISADKISANAIGADKLAANAVTAEKIAANTITVDKLNVTNIFSDSAVITKIQTDIVKTTELDAGKITTGYLNAARIASKSIDVSKLNVTELSAITANLGNITAGNIRGVNISGVNITGSTIISDGVWQTIQSRVQLGNGVITVGNSSANNTVSPVGFIVEQDGGRLHHEFGADGILFYGSAADIFKAGIYVQYEPYGNGISMVLSAQNYTAVTSKFWVRNNEARFQSTANFIDPEPNVMKAIKVSGGIATDGLYANAGSVSKNAIATNGKIYVGGEGIELSWVGGTPYIDFSRRAGVDFDMRLILETDSGLAIRSSDNIVRHKFYANGTKSGGSIEIDGKNLGMSPIDSPQVLLETIEFDVPLTETGTKVLLDTRFAKAVNCRFAVFPNNGRVIEKGADYFIIAGEGLADIRIVGERVGYAGVYFDDMTVEGVV